MSQKINISDYNLLNEEFDKFIDSRVNEMSKLLRKKNKEYVKMLNEVEKIQSKLAKELNSEQREQVNEIIDTLNYLSGIEIYTAYRMAINDFRNLKY